MTARIQRSFDLLVGVHFNSKFHINVYEIELFFNVETESIKEQNIALERIKYFLNEILENSVLCEQSKDKVILDYLNAGIKVCTLPEEPYDQIIGIMLLTKCNAIAEGRLVITDISISSRMSDGVSCSHSLDDNMGPFFGKGWWEESSTKINNGLINSKGKKIVRLTKPIQDWSDIFLDWSTKESKLEEFNASEVVFVEFGSKTEK
jgi:hypothetical protein